jgi:hypothetical protein
MALAPAAAALGWFAFRGALADLVDVHLLYTWNVYSSAAPVRHWGIVRRTADFFLSDPVVFALPVMAAGAGSLWLGARGPARMIVAWAALATLCVASQGRFFRYHWVIVFPPALLLAAAGFDALRRPARRGHAPAVRLLSAIALALGLAALVRVAVIPAAGVAQWVRLVTGRMGRERYYAAHAAGAYVAGDDMKAAAYIRDRTHPADTVAVYGNNAGINFLSGRKNPTRFVFALPLTQGGRSSYRSQYRREYMAGLRRRLPAYVVVGVPWGGWTKDEAVRDFPEFQGLLAQQYRLETRIGALDLYRLQPPPAVPAHAGR